MSLLLTRCPPKQSLLYRAETGLCIHSATCQVESLHPAADHTKSRIIKIDICVIQISFRIQFVYSMASYYIQRHIVCSSSLPPHSLPLLSSTAKVDHSKSLSLSLSPPPYSLSLSLSPSLTPHLCRLQGRTCLWLTLFYSPARPVFSPVCKLFTD